MSGQRKKSPIDPAKIELYEMMVAGTPDAERKGADNPYTSVNGNMFSLLLSPDGRLGLRLPEGEREKFLAKHKTSLFEAYGTVMKEYVAVPDALLARTQEIQKYFRVSYEYAKTLRPKPTKKPAK